MLIRQGLSSVLVLMAVVTGLHGQDSARAIVEKAVAAHGGAAQLGRIRADHIQVKGTLFVEGKETPFTGDCERGGVLAIPVSHGEGRFVADPSTLDRLEAEQRVAFRYVARDGTAVGDASPNGSMRDIAGVVSEGRNVLGMMPHPERAAEPLLGSDDGMRIFRSVVEAVAERAAFAVAP